MGFTSLLLEDTLLGVVDTVAVGVLGFTSLLLPAPPPGVPDTAEPPPACFPPPASFFTTCCWPPPVTPSPGAELPPPLPPAEDVWDAFCCANLSCLRNLARRFWNQTCKTWKVSIRSFEPLDRHYVWNIQNIQLKTRIKGKYIIQSYQMK
jgi:hypothetical protein